MEPDRAFGRDPDPPPEGRAVSGLRVTGTALVDGVWYGQAAGAGEAPELTAWHGEVALGAPELRAEGEGQWALKLPLPPEVLNDGVQVIALRDSAGETVETLTILAGRPLESDLRAEIATLRAELDLVKRALRRLGSGG